MGLLSSNHWKTARKARTWAVWLEDRVRIHGQKGADTHLRQGKLGNGWRDWVAEHVGSNRGGDSSPRGDRLSWRLPAIKIQELRFWSGRKEDVENTSLHLGRCGETNRQNTGFLGQCGSPGGSRNGPRTSLNISSNTQNVRCQERTRTWIVVFGWWWHVPVASSVVTNGPFRGRVVTLREVDGRSLYFAFSFTMTLKLL